MLNREAFLAFLVAFRAWIRTELPRLNSAVEAGAELGGFLSAVQPWMTKFERLIQPVIQELSRFEARDALQLASFVVGSTERHFQARQLQPGLGLCQFGNLDQMLVELGRIAGHPPVGSHYTYWIWNDETSPILFTGDDQETHFSRVVRTTERLHQDSCQALRPICNLACEFSSSVATAAIMRAARNTAELCGEFSSFIKEIDGVWAFQPDFFTRRMRTYLPTYPVCGTEWSGVNAANLASQMSMDFLLGTTSQKYMGTVRERWRYLTLEDQIALDRDMHLASLTSIAMTTSGLDGSVIQSVSDEELVNVISSQPDNIREALLAYEQLFNAWARLTGIHWMLIYHYLIEPTSRMSREEIASLPVRPDMGTGHMSHADTMSIRDMRRKHPVAGKLASAIAVARRTHVYCAN
jgi:hypothetical protein